MQIYESDEVVTYLKKRNMVKAYLKAKNYFEKGLTINIDFKLLKPKQYGHYQFKINNKYRAKGYFRDENFLVTEISDHQ